MKETYPTRLDEFDLGKWGSVMFFNWLHPCEQKKTFSQRQIDWLHNFVNPGDIVIDVGAFTGDTAIPLAVAASKTGTVHAFEPNPNSRNVLVRNSTLNQDIARIIVHPYAIGVEKGDAIFHYHAKQINGGLLTDGDPINVHCIRLDEAGFRRNIAFIKFDCEGQDAELLGEYSPWLKAQGTVVQVERYPSLTEQQCKELWKCIVDYGTPFLEDDFSFTELKELPRGLCNIVIKPK